jgi:hypothetical protein
MLVMTVFVFSQGAAKTDAVTVFSIHHQRQCRINLRRVLTELLDHLSPSILVLVPMLGLKLCVLTYITIQDAKYALEVSAHLGTVFGIPMAIVVYVSFAVSAVTVLCLLADAGHKIEQAVS